MNIKKLVALMILGSCAASNAVIKYASKWEKTIDGKTRTLFLLGDWHAEYITDAKLRYQAEYTEADQKSLILTYGINLQDDGKKVFYIVEDINMFTYMTHMRGLYPEFCRIGDPCHTLTRCHIDPSPITLSYWCNSRALPVYNAEFRSITQAGRKGRISLQTTLKHLNAILTEIEGYSDAGIRYNVTEARSLEEQMKTFTSSSNDDRIGLGSRTAVMAPLYNKLREVESTLIEIRMIHKLYEQQNNYDTIFIAAGLNHIRKVEKILPHLNYHKVDSVEHSLDTLTTDENATNWTPVNLEQFFKGVPRQTPHANVNKPSGPVGIPP